MKGAATAGLGLGGGGPSRATSLLRSLRTSVFGAMFVMSRKATEEPPLVSYALAALRCAQMFSFIVSSRYGRSWPSFFSRVVDVANVANLGILSAIKDATVYGALYGVALAWALVLAVLLIYSIVCFMRSYYPFLWPFRLLRIMGTLSASIAFIPILQQILASFRCSNVSNVGRIDLTFHSPFWDRFNCSGPTILTLQIVTAILAVVLIALAVLFAAIFYPNDSLSRGSASRVHGRMNVIMLGIQTVLVLVAQTFVNNVSDTVVIGFVVAAGPIWVGSLLLFMPYYAHNMNRLYCAVSLG
jgi:hypothetical protein